MLQLLQLYVLLFSGEDHCLAQQFLSMQQQLLSMVIQEEVFMPGWVAKYGSDK